MKFSELVRLLQEHVQLLAQQGFPVPPRNPEPVVMIRNERKGAA